MKKTVWAYMWAAVSLLILVLLVRSAALAVQPGLSPVSTTGTLSALGSVPVSGLGGLGQCTTAITGTWVGTITFELAPDGVTFSAAATTSPLSTSTVTTTTTPGTYVTTFSGTPQLAFRARFSAYTSGTAYFDITCIQASASNSTSNPSFTRIQDGTSAGLATVNYGSLQVSFYSGGIPINAVYGNTDGSSANNLAFASYSETIAFNGSSWDRVRKDPYAAGPLWANGGGSATSVIVAAAAGPTIIKASAGRIVRLVVTVAGTVSETIYDNASACSGTILAVTPATTTVGQVIEFSMPAANGITGCGGAGSPGVTVSYY